MGKCCLCGCWFPKIDVDFHCVYPIKTSTAAVGEFQHRDFCRACTLHKHNKKTSKTANLHNTPMQESPLFHKVLVSKETVLELSIMIKPLVVNKSFCLNDTVGPDDLLQLGR